MSLISHLLYKHRTIEANMERSSSQMMMTVFDKAKKNDRGERPVRHEAQYAFAVLYSPIVRTSLRDRIQNVHEQV